MTCCSDQGGRTGQRKPAAVALLTAPGRSAIAVLGFSGSGSRRVLLRRFEGASGASARGEWEMGRVYFGRWRFADGLAEEVVLCRVGAEAFEVHCHGGPAVVQRLLDDCRQFGIQVKDASDWPSERAKLRRTSQQAWHVLPHAPTERTAAILLAQARGALDDALDECIAALRRADEHAQAPVAELLRRSAYGLHLTTPFRVVVAGPPNVGKSSLVNRLVGFQRSIAHDRAGTTRDVLDSVVAYHGFALTLSDVAGIRESCDDTVEGVGIRKAWDRIQQADLVLWVEDAGNRNSSITIPDAVRARAPLPVINKCDLVGATGSTPDALRVSALTGDGIDALWSTIESRLFPNVREKDAVPFLPSHVQALKECARLIGSSAWEEAADILSGIGDHQPSV